MSGRLKEGKAKAFQDRWTNEDYLKRMKETLPNGVKHIGTYLVVIQSADHDFEQWFELENWAAIDTWRKEIDDPNSKYRKFAEENATDFELLVIPDSRKSKFLRPVDEFTFIQPKD